MPSLALSRQRSGQTPQLGCNPSEASLFRVRSDAGNLRGNPKAPNHSHSLTPGGRIRIVARAGATGFEPAIFGLTGRRVNRYTTPPNQQGKYYHTRQTVVNGEFVRRDTVPTLY